MKWAKVKGTFGCWRLKGNEIFSAAINRGNLAAEGQDPQWCYYASITIKDHEETSHLVFWKEQDARDWCEGKIMPEVKLMEVGELA